MAKAPRSVPATAGAAVLVIVGCLVTAYLLRPSAPGSAAGPPTGEDDLRCGGADCRSVVKADVGADTVDLVVGAGTGRIRIVGAGGSNIFESTVVESGARIDERSLECVASKVSVCLVRGPSGDEVLGEVLVGRDGTWNRAQARYLATGGYLALHDVDGDAVADVVAVQRECDGKVCARVYAQVFSFTGSREPLGCTAPVDTDEELPGWPAVAPAAADLSPCGA
ncbi:hypothetical protein [Umezawaea sp. Da 62-37]|uniref:hypothetical protein n=1 Tax=Umezawaea sp. Da 62-37 TaxID=3075927 RepID=UPI0028F6E6BE|nr:hypothetical protein [Umezawaea sp. Da 62-37]WNV90662.1 hypothetical protein RM788_20975 [Umezawaea sp. Da 62-37]